MFVVIIDGHFLIFLFGVFTVRKMARSIVAHIAVFPVWNHKATVRGATDFVAIDGVIGDTTLVQILTVIIG